MCESIAKGGKRCNNSIVGFSNYPHLAKIVDGKWNFDSSGLAKNPNALFHTMIVSARSAVPMPKGLKELFTVNANTWESMDKSQRWEFWNSVTSIDNPSHVLEAIHENGLEHNFPELAAIRDVPQSPEWHPEGPVHVHIQQAGDVAASNATRDGLTGVERQIAVLGSICHDFGKSTHTQFKEDGKISSIGHDMAGVPYSRSFLKSIGAPQKVVDIVPILVKTHMCHANPNPTRKTMTKLVEKLEERGATLYQLARILDADTGGRGEASTTGVGTKWVKLYEDYNRVEKKSSVPRLDGKFLNQMGVPQGEIYREILQSFKDSGEVFEPNATKTWVENFLKTS